MFMASNSKQVPTLKLNCGTFTLNLGKLCPDECASPNPYLFLYFLAFTLSTDGPEQNPNLD